MNQSNDQSTTRGSGPVLPYPDPEAGQTSGYSGTDTSADRAHREDADGTTGKRQRAALNWLNASEHRGLTVHELGEIMNWHHGQVSAVLSNLHLAGRISRLAETRKGCKVYVRHEHVNGRTTEEHKSNKRKSETDLLATARMLRAALAGVSPDYCITHTGFTNGCRRCIAAKALRDTRSL